MGTTIIFRPSPNTPPMPGYQMEEILRNISPVISEFQSHLFENGIYLVKRKSTYAPFIKEHYGVAIIGRYLRNFNPQWNKATVIHKTNLGVRRDNFNPFEWEKVEKISEQNITDAVNRTGITMNDAYDLLSDNCEHFARFVTTGKKESTQVQNAVKLGIAGVIAYFLFR